MDERFLVTPAPQVASGNRQCQVNSVTLGQLDAYERYMGRWSRLVAREVLDWLALPAKLKWLDVGCGVGALTSEILARAAPASVTGWDSSEGFLTYARKQIPYANASFRPGDAQALPFADKSFDAAVSGLVLNFVRSSERATGEMRRVLRPGGVAAAYVWDYAGNMELIQRFAIPLIARAFAVRAI